MDLDLKPMLRERGLSQKDLAKALDVSEPTVSAWCAHLRSGVGQRIPAEKARAIADILQIEPGLLRPDLWPGRPASAEAA